MTLKEIYLIRHIEQLQASLRLISAITEVPAVKSIIEETIINSENLVNVAKEELLNVNEK